MFRYVLAWIPMLVIAIANGAVRQMTYGKVLPELRAHQLSTLTGSLVLGAFIWFVIHAWPPSSGRQALAVGLVWLSLTVAFESFMGLVLMKRTTAQILADYNILAGRVWVLLLIWLAVAPWLFYRFRSTS